MVDRITDVKELLEVERLRESNRDLEQTLYTVGHDLQEPLRAIRGFATMLSRCEELNGSSKFVDEILDGCDRMQRRFSALREFTHAGRFEFNGPVSLEQVFMDALNALQHVVAQVDPRIEKAPLPLVRGAREPLISVFQNLLSNAMKYRRPDERVEIHISARNTPDRGLTMVTIEDNGLGFNPEHEERVFEFGTRFANGQSGDGMGLAITKRIIERLGGSIWAKTSLGEGTKFSFTLPLARIHS